MVYFQTKNTNFWFIFKGVGLKNLVYFLVIWYFIAYHFGIFYAIWYFRVHVGILFFHVDFVVPK
jgi:hypothetical protein